MFMHPRLPDFDNVVDRALREQPVPPLNPPGDKCLYEGRLSLHRENYLMKLLTRVGNDAVKEADDLVARCEYEVWRLQGDVIVPNISLQIKDVHFLGKKTVYPRNWQTDKYFDCRHKPNTPVIKTCNFGADVAKELEKNSLETGFEDVPDMNPEAVRKMRETSLLGILRGVGARHVCAANKILEDHRFVSSFIWAPLEQAMLVQFKMFAQQWSSAQKQSVVNQHLPMAGTLAAVKLQFYVVSFVVVFFPSGIFLDLHHHDHHHHLHLHQNNSVTFYSQTHDGGAQGVVNAVLDFLYTIVPTIDDDVYSSVPINSVCTEVFTNKRREVLDKYDV